MSKSCRLKLFANQKAFHKINMLIWKSRQGCWSKLMTHYYSVRYRELLFWKSTHQAVPALEQELADLKPQLAFKDEVGSILQFFFFYKSQTQDQNQQSIDPTNKYYLCIQNLTRLLPLSHRAPLLSKLKTHQWATLLHRLTCSFITMNTHTVVYFVSILHTPSCCPKAH